MKFTDLFVKRPVLAIVVNLVILIAGLQAIRSLSVRQYPRSDIAVVQVTTVYVGANADLVRGFVTTPIERVIASADGIDYMESTSAQGLSTILVHLKINYDTTAALTQIQAKVAQVRNDLPPEAQIPVIDLQTADTAVRRDVYRGFFCRSRSEPDYRLSDPRRSAQAKRDQRCAARRHPGRPDVRHAYLAEAGRNGCARRFAVRRARCAVEEQLSFGARSTKGSMVSVNLIANTDLRTPDEFRQMVVKQENGVVVRLGEIADVQLGAENYDQDVRFNGETATFMGIWVLPTANSLDVIKKVRKELPAIQQQLPTGMTVGHSLRLDRIHSGRDQRSAAHARRNSAHRRRCHLPFPGIVPLRTDSDRRDSDLADWRSLPHAGGGLHHQSSDAAGHCAFGRTGGRRRHRDGGKRRAPPADGQDSIPGGERCRARTGRPDHRHDDYAGRRLRPDRHSGRTDRSALPRIRVHPGRRGHRLRHRGAHAVADDGFEAAARRRHRARDLPASSIAVSRRCAEPIRRLLTGTLNYRPVVLTVWVIVAVLMVPFYMFSQRELAPSEDQGVVFGVIQASANATLDQTNLFTQAGVRRLPLVPREREYLSDHESERRFRRHGHEALEPAQEDHAAIAGRVGRDRFRRSPAFV